MFLINFLPVLAPVIKIILVFAGLLILPPPDSPGKPLAADRTDNQPRQQVLMIQAVCLIPLDTRFLPSLLRRRPQFSINDRLMPSVRDHVILHLNPVVFIPGSFHPFRGTLSISDFPDIHRIVQHPHDEPPRKIIQFKLPILLLCISPLVQVIADRIRSHAFVDKFLINDFYNRRFFRLHHQGTCLRIQPIPERCQPAVPFPFPRLLLPAFHRLHQDILPLNLRHCGQDSDGQLTGIL